MSSTRSRATTATRERIILGAAELTAAQGWPQVTMSRLADHVGVSRQTVYNEFGSRSSLAEAMVLHELGLFLTEVDEGFDVHPGDLAAGVAEATRRVLELARINPLLGAIVTATHGGETELVPLLTTRSDAVIAAASHAVRSRMERYDCEATMSIDVVVDVIVRTVLSHVMQPGGNPQEIGDNLGAVVARLIVSR